MLCLLCCYYLHFIHYSELLRASLEFKTLAKRHLFAPSIAACSQMLIYY